MKVICNLSPVSTSIMVVDAEGHQKESVVCTMDTFANKMFELANKYDAKQSIYFSGPIAFTNGVLNLISADDTCKFSLSEYKIHIL